MSTGMEGMISVVADLWAKEVGKLEAMRGTGECVRCQRVYEEGYIDNVFRVENPFTGETKLSLLCIDCRQIVARNMRA